MSSSSESEGEIIEAKATTAQHHDNDTSINTPDRNPSASKSPIRSLDGHYDRELSPRGEKRRHDDYHVSSRRDDYGYRQGSYGRDNRDASYHASHFRDERDRDNSHRNTYDSDRASHRRDEYGGHRRNHRHYDDRRPDGRSRRRKYYDYDNPENTSAIKVHDEHYESGHRSMSRSPKRYKTENSQGSGDQSSLMQRQVPQEHRRREFRQDAGDNKRKVQEYPVSDRGTFPSRSRHSELQAERFPHTSHQILKLQGALAEQSGLVPVPSCQFIPNLNNLHRSKAHSDIERGPTAQVKPDETTYSKPDPVISSESVDEDALVKQRREERRKRVEEIKAKHAAQAASSTQQIQVNTESVADSPQLGNDTSQTKAISPSVGSVIPQPGATTPPADATNPSFDGTGEHCRSHQCLLRTNWPSASSVSSPRTPLDDNAVGSPAEIAVQNDEELSRSISNAGVADGDGPSAAEYDPRADMQADKLRDIQRHQGDVAAQDYEETDTKEVLTPEGSVGRPVPDQKPKKSTTDIDMFAEDDDDMFAAEPNDQVKQGSNKLPKELNASMLDDWDTPDGYYKVILGELLDKRYVVKEKIGSGVFSGVIRAVDEKMDKTVAIKIIRSNESMKKAAVTEVSVLLNLKEKDPQNRKHVVRLERYFEHKGHLCMVFENLSMDMRSVLKKFGRGTGLHMKAVRTYTHQMFLALLLLKEADILHADLKPDNILLNEARSVLKVCDLGSAVDISDVYANDPRPYLASRFYRAPELILGMKYDFGIDMWSIGCTLFELFTCRILFSGRNNNAMLRSMMECRGRFPQKMLKRASEVRYATNGIVEFPFNDTLDNFYSRDEEKVTGKEVGKWIGLTKIAEPGRDLRSRIFAVVDEKKISLAERNELNLFHDLLDKCLQLNPDKRITPEQALQHPFLRGHSSIRK